DVCSSDLPHRKGDRRERRHLELDAAVELHQPAGPQGIVAAVVVLRRRQAIAARGQRPADEEPHRPQVLVDHLLGLGWGAKGNGENRSRGEPPGKGAERGSRGHVRSSAKHLWRGSATIYRAPAGADEGRVVITWSY